ncbi:MAG: 30S ribosomal protein S12 methylthiotransferase RimO [Desulfobulbus sp.]|nr:30S ribosomal protein S12 methylthiotransferase RimO [Desulfobulbus sp.]
MKNLLMVSLGCPKNLVDSEVMLSTLELAGYCLTDVPEKAQIILVNTCGFIRPAVEEAIDTILELAAYKDENPELRLIVTGCMVQRYGQALLDELPEVDLFIGLDDFPDLDKILAENAQIPRLIAQPGSATFLMNSAHTRRLTTPSFRSYLKITEGCDNRCSYCMIPSIRGKLRSREISDLITEAVALQEIGTRELCLIAQDLTAYGNDLPTNANLVQLLEQLLLHTDIPWFRLLYAYPSGISDDLLQLMANNPRIVPYLDVPFQHVSDPVLQRMNRHHGYQVLDDLIARIRQFLPECAVRTTLMVGFPGETTADVDAMVAALQRWQLDHVGVFQYQDEEGSLAALLSGKVEDEEKAARYERVMTIQADISQQRMQRFIGRVEPVLVEGVSEESDLLLEGRTCFQAPDIDGCVYITSGTVNPGDIVLVQITEAHTYDLVGEVVDHR